MIKTEKLKGRRKSNFPKDPNEPPKPPKPYTRYSRIVWEKVQIENPLMNIGQIGNTVGKMWRNLPDNEKEIYNNEFQKDWTIYEEVLQKYRQSEGYRKWLSRVRENQTKEAMQKQISMPVTVPVHNFPVENQIRQQQIPKYQGPEYTAMEANQDSSDEEFSHKIEAWDRYKKNQETMLELFSDTTLSEQMLKEDPLFLNNSDNSIIEYYQQKIDNSTQEMSDMTKQHEARLARMNNTSESFKKLMEDEFKSMKQQYLMLQRRNMNSSNNNMKQN